MSTQSKINQKVRQSKQTNIKSDLSLLNYQHLLAPSVYCIVDEQRTIQSNFGWLEVYLGYNYYYYYLNAKAQGHILVCLKPFHPPTPDMLNALPRPGDRAAQETEFLNIQTSPQLSGLLKQTLVIR